MNGSQNVNFLVRQGYLFRIPSCQLLIHRFGASFRVNWMSASSRHLLRLLVSCRKLSAEVFVPHSQTIVAMANSTEPEFALHQRALLARNPRTKLLWDPATAARVGENLARRLLAVGVDGVSFNLDEELARPIHWRHSVSPFFEVVRRSGVRIEGAEKLQW